MPPTESRPTTTPAADGNVKRMQAQKIRRSLFFSVPYFLPTLIQAQEAAENLAVRVSIGRKRKRTATTTHSSHGDKIRPSLSVVFRRLCRRRTCAHAHTRTRTHAHTQRQKKTADKSMSAGCCVARLSLPLGAAVNETATNATGGRMFFGYTKAARLHSHYITPPPTMPNA